MEVKGVEAYGEHIEVEDKLRRRTIRAKKEEIKNEDVEGYGASSNHR